MSINFGIPLNDLKKWSLKDLETALEVIAERGKHG
jgi:hypothetical protein